MTSVGFECTPIHMIEIAVTGGIACGKSLVSGFFGELGARVCSADTFAHEALVPDGEAFVGVVARFGHGILDPAGEIDRRALARTVFGDAEARCELERLVHGPVKRQIRRWLSLPSEALVSVVEVPLLYEAGMADDGWGAVVSVVAPSGVQETRLVGLGFTIDEARARMGAQLPVEQKATSADYVVINGTSKRLVKEQVGLIWQKLLKMKK